MTDLPTETPAAEPTFDVLPLAADVRRAVDAMGYRAPTPVQLAVFEPASEGRDLVVQARTGTGKTAAFALPIIDRIVRTSTKGVQALVLCPTRELALQVSREFEQIGQFRGTRVVPIYGGAPMTRQVAALEAGVHIVVGTPGRVLDHLRHKTLDPSGVRVLVLDEADEMLSMGFAKELNAILELLPKSRQGLFFSATLPPDIERLAHNQLRSPEIVTLSSDQVGALEIEHYLYVMHAGDKMGQLVRILEVEDPESAIIFCNTRDETLRVAEGLKARGFDADWLNGDLPQNDRERVMNATKEGKLRFLVATDVAARGIDISHLTHVINYDFPETAEQYVHRTGRTGRAGRTGTAIAIVGPKDIGNVYLLRLTYKIRPIEKQLPSPGEVKTRAELDLVHLFVEAFASRPAHIDDLSLARRVLTHHDAERIVAGLLRDHLGARGGDAAGAAAEARRARNPPPRQAREDAAPANVEDIAAHRGRAPAASAVRSEAPRERPARLEPSAPAAVARTEPSPSRIEPTATRTEPSPARFGRSEEGGRRDPRRPRRDAAAPSAPYAAATAKHPSWAPPREADDERPILSAADSESRLPGVTISSPGETEADQVELFINIGKREGVLASDLQRILIEKGLSPEETGRIRVRDRMTYVVVRKNASGRAIAALAGEVIGGRTVVAELARGRG
jgi:ATP-dependent RNA helicase DeaD